MLNNNILVSVLLFSFCSPIYSLPFNTCSVLWRPLLTTSPGLPQPMVSPARGSEHRTRQVRSQKHFLESVIFKFTSSTILVSPFLCVYFIIIMMEGGEAILKRNVNRSSKPSSNPRICSLVSQLIISTMKPLRPPFQY